MTLVLACLLLPWGGWLLGTGLRRLMLVRVLLGPAALMGGVVALADPASRTMPGATALIFLSAPLLVLAGLLRRLPPRAAPPDAALPVAVAPVASPPAAEPTPDWTAPLPGAPNLLLRYRDTKGDVTDREVRPQGVKGRGAVEPSQASALVGHCLMRKGRRTFRLDRVLHAADPKTGEVIDLPAWLREHMK